MPSVELKFAKYVVNKIGDALFDNFSNKIKDSIIKNKKNVFLKKYQENLESEMLSKYGDEEFYNNLCKILLHDNNIKMIIDRSYQRNLLDYRFDEEIIDLIISKTGTFGVYSHSFIKENLKLLIATAFNSFNSCSHPESIKLSNIIYHIGDRINQNITSKYNEIINIVKKDSTCMARMDKNIENLLSTQDTRFHFDQLGSELKPDEIKEIFSNNYNITLSAKNSDNKFRILIEIAIDLRLSPYNNFGELLSTLRFKGESQTFNVCSFRVETSEGVILKEFDDASYTGLRICIPTVYIEKYELDNCELSSIKIKIEPKFDKLDFAVENEYGEILIPNLTYIIKREILNQKMSIRLCSFDTEKGLGYEFLIEVLEFMSMNLKANSKLNISLQDNATVTQIIGFMSLMKNMINAKQLIGVDKASNNIIMNTSNIKLDTEDIIENFDLKMEVYSTLRNIERLLGICIEVPDTVEVEDIHNIYMMDELFKNGFVNVNIDNINISFDELKDQLGGELNELLNNETCLLTYSIKELKIFNTQLHIIDKIRIGVRANEKPIIEDGIVSFRSYKSVMYNKDLVSEDDMDKILS